MLASLFRTPVIVREGHAGLLYRDGVFLRRLEPGRHRLGVRESVEPVCMMTQTIVVSSQEVLSADAFLPRLSAVTMFTVTDPHLAATANETGYRESLTIEVPYARWPPAGRRKPWRGLGGTNWMASCPPPCARRRPRSACRCRWPGCGTSCCQPICAGC